MNKATVFVWWVVIMILGGGFWYITRWWFILLFFITTLVYHTLRWHLENWWCKHKKRKYRYKWLNDPALSAWNNIYWIEKPTRKDKEEFREIYWTRYDKDLKHF